MKNKNKQTLRYNNCIHFDLNVPDKKLQCFAIPVLKKGKDHCL